MQPSNIFKISGFSRTDTRRIESHFSRLLPYLDTSKVWIVGGLAIRYHLAKHGVRYPIRKFNDIDLVVEDPTAVSPEVKKEFLIYHYHPIKNNSFYIVLIDPSTKTKVDIFDPTTPIEYSQPVNFQGYDIKITGLEGQLVKTVYDIQRISKKTKVDPKQFLDTDLLIEIADMDLADRIWRKRRYSKYPTSIYLAIKRAKKIAKLHPEWVKEHPFKKSKPYKCGDCRSGDGFIVEDMEKIYQILGYVE